MQTEPLDPRGTPQRGSGAGLNVLFWTLQALVALVFLYTGVAKLVMPLDQLAQNMAWVSEVPPALVRFIGLAETAGALGVFLPSATRIAPKLAPLAAVGLTTIMALAAVFHVARGEVGFAGVPVVLGLLTAIVAWGRYRTSPIESRREHHEPPGVAHPPGATPST